MELLPFKQSDDFSLGIELEYQIIHPKTYNLCAQAKELIRSVRETKFDLVVKPEITQSMLEINSSVHTTPGTILHELNEIREFLVTQAKRLNVLFCGGGTHPFQKWVTKKIFPSHRFRKIYRKYQYLSKRATVFGLHVHIGCSSPEHALYLTHVLARFVPQFVAMSASSPFYQGIDTGYDSSRLTIFNTSPFYGTIPYLTDWQQFSNYYFKMKGFGIIENMKDFYWDIRPKPEFGTIEIRVCDTPLTFKKAVLIAAYIQTLACYLLREKPLVISQDVYMLHSYNRFQGARYGLEGQLINPYTLKKIRILDDIMDTIKIIKSSAKYLGNTHFLNELKNEIINHQNDAKLLRQIFDETGNLKELVNEQCRLWIK